MGAQLSLAVGLTGLSRTKEFNYGATHATLLRTPSDLQSRRLSQILAPSERFELPTPTFVALYSSPLSYEGIV